MYRYLFLIDSLGALLSVVLLGFVLGHWQIFLGVPLSVLNVLSSIACLFAVYSGVCFVGKVKSPVYLKAIAIANFLYCVLTFALLFYVKTLTIFGIIYFVSEIIVILTLARLEWKTAQSISN